MAKKKVKAAKKAKPAKKAAKKPAKKAAKKVATETQSKHAVPRDRLLDENGEVVTLYGRERCLMPGDDMQQLFGDNCKVLRLRKGWNVRQFAAMLDIHRTTVHRLEAKPFAHRTSLPLAVRIANVLGESVENMVTIDFSEQRPIS